MFCIKPVSQVVNECKAIIKQKNKSRAVKIENALGAVLAEDIISIEDMPSFARSTVDGYAVKAEDTFGSSENMPSFLEVTNEILMGKEAKEPLDFGKAQKIATGGMLPPGSDAVVMQEYTENIDSMLSIYKAVSPGENVIKAGEDIQQEQVIFTKGHKLRAQDIGILAAMGITLVNIIESITVAVLSTGDELVDPNTKVLKQGQVRDTNGYSVTAFLRKNNYLADYVGICIDDYKLLHDRVHELYLEYDVVIISGGSSVGAKDVTSDIIQTLPEAQLLVHGIAIKPGKPTIIATSKNKLVIGLPGHPVSALVVMQHVISPIIASMQGAKPPAFEPTIRAYVKQNIDSQTGRTDIIRVRCSTDGDKIIAEPLLSKAGVFSSLVKADGYIIISESVEGITKDSEVNVHLY
ncbi:molybdopterin molybdotransferase MoeA [Desulfuribacillus alkaliarsenatis]|uniref:Molybdopterin molybdenumtransferase n=1 Tax=Desulfuribacillus alkaliarsenatis TaxID=766136 RepID=A0A1E5G0W4_9FIRM|nr:gephyrin-like molybdotransferase Glp [Desulfuribacillus alkaliarsenatis]OEF96088.1 hypothetical protein BHF68_10145 [Desulfuribacillus alkaliarsenatis]